MKNGQIQTQIFIYILSMIIVGLVLLYGYNAIKGFRERQETVSLIELENQLENTIKAMSSEYGSIKKQTMPLTGFEMICFVDRELVGRTQVQCTYDANIPIENHNNQKVRDSWSIVEDSINDGTANIFLVPDGTVNYKIGNIQVEGDGCICIEKTGNDVIFRVEGLGNGVKISQW